MNRPSLEVLCLIAQQEASNAAWEAWLCNVPMSWISGVRL